MNEHPKAVPQLVRLSDLNQGKNPRTYFDPVELAELTASVRQKGVTQPIIARLMEDKSLRIVAGERRVRAAREALGEDAEIWAMVHVCTDAEAEVLALIENTQRANMSYAEEAKAANDILLAVKGDMDEAALCLGWDTAKLRKRLALMRLTVEVRTALTERRIQLGHAELLAAVPQAKQNGALEKIIEHKLTVAQVREKVGAMSQELAAAIFDKGECASCQFNSSQQQALFGEAVSEGHCTSPECYATKTEAHLQVLRASLADEVPKVLIVRHDTNVIPIRLVADGPVGVGAAQMGSCRACEDFGYSVSAVLGSLGEVQRDQCFNSACNTTKVAANIAATKAAAAAAAKEAGASAKSPAKVTGTVSMKPGAEGASVKTPQAVRDYRLAQWRQIASRVIYANADAALRILVALGLSGQTRHIDSHKLSDALESLTGEGKGGSMLNVGESATRIASTSHEVLMRLAHAMAASAFKDIDEQQLRGAMRFLDIQMGDHWKLDESFLKLLTKSELEVLAEEIGLAAAMGEKAFNKAGAGKKDAFIAALLAVDGFVYAGVVPKVMDYSETPAKVTYGAESTEQDEEEESGDGTLQEVAEAA